MTASAFSYSWTKLSGNILDIIRNVPFILVNPLRSPMSIFSKSPDLEKCEAGAKE